MIFIYIHNDKLQIKPEFTVSYSMDKKQQQQIQQNSACVIRSMIKVIDKIFLNYELIKSQHQVQQNISTNIQSSRTWPSQLQIKKQQLEIYVQLVNETMRIGYLNVCENINQNKQIKNPFKSNFVGIQANYLHKFAATISLLTIINFQSFYLLYKEFYYFERNISNVLSIWQKLDDHSQQNKLNSQLHSVDCQIRNLKQRQKELILIQANAEKELLIKIFDLLKIYYQKQQQQQIKNYRQFFIPIECKLEVSEKVQKAIQCNQNFFNYIMKLLVDLSLIRIRHIFLEKVIDLDDNQKQKLMPFVEDVVQRSFVQKSLVNQSVSPQNITQCSKCKQFRFEQQQRNQRRKSFKRKPSKRSKSKQNESKIKNDIPKNVDLIALVEQLDQLRQKYSELQNQHSQLQQNHKILKDSQSQVKKQIELLRQQRENLIISLEIRNQNVTCQDIAQRYRSDIKELSNQIQKLCQQVDQKNELLTIKASDINDGTRNFQSFSQCQLKKSNNGKYTKSIDIFVDKQGVQQSENWKKQDFERLRKLQELQSERVNQISNLKQVIKNLIAAQVTKDRRISELQIIQQKFNRLKKKHTQFHQTVDKFSERQTK